MLLPQAGSDLTSGVEDVELLRTIFENQKNVKIILHEGDVKHGFGDPGSDGFHPEVYQKAVASEVYQKAVASVVSLIDGLR